MVEEYRDAYWAWENQMREETIGYETEMKEYRDRNPSPKFKDWLRERWKQPTEEEIYGTHHASSGLYPAGEQ